jgi:hypothetical protein
MTVYFKLREPEDMHAHFAMKVETLYTGNTLILAYDAGFINFRQFDISVLLELYDVVSHKEDREFCDSVFDSVKIDVLRDFMSSYVNFVTENLDRRV